MSNNNGLTLLECLIVISLSVILLFSATSAYRHFTYKNQLSLLVNQFTDALEFARNAAITSQSTITFCPNNGDETCGTHWQNGQLIMDEKNQRVLRQLPVMPARFHLYWRSTLGDSRQLRWRSDGFTRGQQGSFYVCGQKGSSAQIIILRTGRLREVMGNIAACDQMI